VISTVISFQQAKYKKVMRAIEKETAESEALDAHNAKLKQHREQMQAKLVEIQKREQQKTAKPYSQRYRENYSFDTLTTGTTAGTSTTNHSRIRPTITEPSLPASITSTFQKTTIHSRSRRRRHQPKRGESSKLSQVAEFKRFINYRSINRRESTGSMQSSRTPFFA
jgi:hypothetical protein